MDTFNSETSVEVDMTRWIHEMKGESSDRPSREMQEQLSDDFILALEQHNLRGVAELCAPDARLLANLRGPGQIFEGLHEIQRYCEQYEGHASGLTTIVDRYRVTKIINFYPRRNDFTQLRAIILDMNDDFKFIRIEMRPLGPEQRTELNKLNVIPFLIDNSL